jgi:hypothetical protein
MFLLKDLWVSFVLPELSIIDICRFQCVSKHCLWLTQSFQHKLDHWKKLTQTENINTLFVTASREGDLDLMRLFINRGAMEWDTALEVASQTGKKDVVFFLTDCIETYCIAFGFNSGLYGASAGGHDDLIRYFIDKGAEDFDGALSAAAAYNNHRVVQMLISYGACEWESGLLGATQGGHQEMVEFFINKGATNFDEGLEDAAEYGHKHLVELFIGYGADDWDMGMLSATYGEHIDLINFFIEKGATDFEQARVCAIHTGNPEIVNLFEEKIRNLNNEI